MKPPFATLVLACMAAPAAHAAAVPAAAAPAPPDPVSPPRSVEELRTRTSPQAAIFTYTVDDACRIGDTRKLQGPDDVRWQDAESALDIAAESGTFRYVDGMRTRLTERRVKLLGEMVREGELVCHIRPSGEVIAAWIEFRNPDAGRRRSLSRETVPVRDGTIGDLGTFSLVLAP